MAPKFKTTVASCKCTLKDAFKAAGYEAKKEDIICYPLVKQGSVSSTHEIALLKGRILLLGAMAKKLLGIDGCKAGPVGKMRLDPASVPGGFTCFVQSTSHNRKVSKGTQLLVVVSEGKAAARDVKRKPATKTVMKSKTTSKGNKSDLRSDELSSLFLRFGELGPPATAAKVPLDAPASLQSLMKVASHWHIRKDHYGVFGFNLFDKRCGYLDKVCLMGDEDMVKQWAQEHPKPNCGEESWKCIAAISEFHFIFVNVDPASKQFGATRSIVNNCFDDKPLTKAPFENFLNKMASYAKKYVSWREKAGENWEDEEPPQFPVAA